MNKTLVMEQETSGKAKKMIMPFESLVAEGLHCQLRTSYKIDKGLFDECLDGLPAFTNCLISGLDPVSSECEVTYFVPQGEIFSKKNLMSLFYKPYVFDLVFFDTHIDGVPIFGMPGMSIFEISAIHQFSSFRSLLEFESTHSYFLRDYVISSTLEKISLYLLREMKDHQPEIFDKFNQYFENSRLLKVLTFMHQHVNEDLTLERLGELVDLSPDYISQFFKRCVGMSIQAYLIDQRVKKGLHYLVSTNDQISTISENTGFIDQAYFNRRFKIFYNMNPLRLRKQYQLLFISRAGALLTLEKR